MQWQRPVTGTPVLSRVPPLRHWAGALLALLMLLAGWTASHAQDPASARKFYRIEAGALDAVLNRFGREAGILISFRPELTAGLRSPGVEGTLTPAEGLAA